MSRVRKTRKTKYDPLAQPDDPKAIAAFYSDVSGSGPYAEGGPAAWTDQPWTVESPLVANDVLGVAIASMAKRPKFRPIFNYDGIRLVMVITDAVLKPDDINLAIKRTASITGTFTEGRRLAEKVRWLDFCSGSPVANIAKVTSNELAMAIEESPGLTQDNILFLVWKEHPDSFGGIAKLELAREICHSLFTYEKSTDQPYQDSYCDKDDDDLSGEGWKKGGA